MDNQALIELLNEDLESEFQSIVQYVNHIATVTGPEYKAVVDEVKVHLSQELDHATTLAEQIAFLGGEPSTSVPQVPEHVDSSAALQHDLDLETGQLERYRERVNQAEKLGLADVAERLRPLLTETQDHVNELRGVLIR